MRFNCPIVAYVCLYSILCDVFCDVIPFPDLARGIDGWKLMANVCAIHLGPEASDEELRRAFQPPENAQAVNRQ